MKTKIRWAKKEDAHAFMHIKNNLSFKNVNGTTTKGGFLLGTNLKTYEQYIEHEYCLVAEHHSEIIGFGIVLKNETLKLSDIWAKRSQAYWNINIHEFEFERISYFEQLAFLKGYSKTVLKLGYLMMNLAMQEHKYMFTTTVHSPVLNLAAVPYILKAGGKLVGNIDEEYPDIGKIKSDIYMIDAESYFNKQETTFLGKYLKSQCTDEQL